MNPNDPPRPPLIVPPGGGRVYAMGRMRAIFKADGAETANLYSVSEWRLEPRTRGPLVHQHDEDHVYYVIEGVLSVSLNDQWSEAPAGSYILIPGGTPHDFANRGAEPTAFITFNSDGGFEARMPDIAEALSSEDLSL